MTTTNLDLSAASSPYLTPSSSASSSYALLPSPRILIHSKEELKRHLERIDFIDSDGKIKSNLEINFPTLLQIKGSVERFNKLVLDPFTFYTSDKHNPQPLGVMSAFIPLMPFIHVGLPVKLVGSAVWHVLGIDYFRAVLSQLSVDLSDSFAAEINAKYNDVDVSVDCSALSNNPDYSVIEHGKRVILHTLLPRLYLQEPPLTVDHLANLALIKNHYVNPRMYVAAFGSKRGTRAEYTLLDNRNLTAEQLKDAPTLFQRNSVRISNNDYTISAPYGDLKQSIIDFLLDLLRADDISKIDDIGWTRYLGYVLSGSKTIGCELNEKLTLQVLSRAPGGAYLANHIIKLLLHAYNNHLVSLPNGLLKLTFIASYELSKHLSKEQFIQLWDLAIKENFQTSPSFGEHTLRGIAEKFQQAKLIPLPFFHLLCLTRNPLVKGFGHPLSPSLLEEYCHNPAPLQLAHAAFGELTHSAIHYLFQELILSPAAYTLWDKLQHHMSEEEKAHFMPHLPFKKLDPRVLLFTPNISAAAAAAAPVPQVDIPAETSLLLNTVSTPVEKPKAILAAKAALPEPKKVAPKVEKKRVVEAPVVAKPKVQEPKTLYQLKGNEPDFQQVFDKGCQECIDAALEDPKKAGSQVQQLLNFGKNKFSNLTSHTLFAEVLLVGLTLKEKIKQDNYKITPGKIELPEKRLNFLFQLSLHQFSCDNADFSKILQTTTLDKEADKKIRHLLKERKNITFNPEDITSWLKALHDASLVEEIKLWIDLIIAHPKALIKVSPELKELTLKLSLLPNISSITLNKLRKLIFKDSEESLNFFYAFAKREDKSALSLSWEMLNGVTDDETVENYIKNLTPEGALKLIEESDDSNSLPLLSPFRGTPAHLQHYCDTLIEALLQDKGRPRELIASQLLKYVNKQAPLLTCHQRFARLYLEVKEAKKKLGKETLQIELSKIAHPERKLELLSLFDVQAIPYPAFDISSLVKELSFSTQNDDNLRRHMNHLAKAPCDKEALLGWLEKVLDQGTEVELKKWLPLITGPLRSILEGSLLLNTLATTSSKLTDLTPELMWALKSMLPAQHDSNLFFNYFLSHPSESAIVYVEKLCLTDDSGSLWPRFFNERPCTFLLTYLGKIEDFSFATRQIFFATLLKIPLSDVQKETHFKLLLNLKNNITPLDPQTALLWINWLLTLVETNSHDINSSRKLALVQVEKELEDYNTPELVVRWIRVLSEQPKETRVLYADKVDALLPHLTLAKKERVTIYALFGLYRNLTKYLGKEMLSLDFPTRVEILEKAIVPYLPVLVVLQETVLDTQLRSFLGDQAFSKLMTHWLLNYTEASISLNLEENAVMLVLEGENVTARPFTTLEILKASSNFCIMTLGNIDISNEQLEMKCFNNISKLIARLVASGCAEGELRTFLNNFLFQAFGNLERRAAPKTSDWFPLLSDISTVHHIEYVKPSQQARAALFIMKAVEDLLDFPDTISLEQFNFVSSSCLQLLHQVIPFQAPFRERFFRSVMRYLECSDIYPHDELVRSHLANAQALVTYAIAHEKELKSSPYVERYAQKDAQLLESILRIRKSFSDEIGKLKELDTPLACEQACHLLLKHFTLLIKDPMLLIHGWATALNLFKAHPQASVNGVPLHDIVHSVLIERYYEVTPQVGEAKYQSAIFCMIRNYISIIVNTPYPLSKSDLRTSTVDLIIHFIDAGGYKFLESDYLEVLSALVDNPTRWLTLDRSKRFSHLDPVFTLIAVVYNPTLSTSTIRSLGLLSIAWIKNLLLLSLEKSSRSAAFLHRQKFLWLHEEHPVNSDDAHRYLKMIKAHIDSKSLFWPHCPDLRDTALALLQPLNTAK